MRALVLLTLALVGCGGGDGPVDMTGWGYPRCDPPTHVFYLCVTPDREQCYAPYDPAKGKADAVCAICEEATPVGGVFVGGCYLTEAYVPGVGGTGERYCAADCSECETRPSGAVSTSCQHQ